MSVWCFLGSAGAGNDDYELLQTVPLVEGIIGSDPSCEVRLHDPLLTPRHAQVVRRDDAWFIGGIAAMSPTLINGVATLPGQAVQLAVGDVIELGNTRFRFGGEPPARQLGPEPRERKLPGLEEFLDGELITPEWRGGFLAAAGVRELNLGTLRRLLETEAAVALERLTVQLSTCGDKSELENLRALFQILAVTKPPRLRELRLGYLHQPLSDGAARDWAAIARRIPLEGSLSDAYRVAGPLRFTMLRAGEGTPPLGAVTAVDQMSVEGFREGRDAVRQINVMAAPGAGAVFLCAEEFMLNGVDSWEMRRLVHGDVVQGERFSFRFEEDLQ